MSDKITIRYERSGRCFWHIGCKAQHHAPPMRIGADDGARTLIHCTACGESGYYPHGSVGDVCCEPVTAPAAQPADSAMEVLREFLDLLDNPQPLTRSIHEAAAASIAWSKKFEAAKTRARALTAASKERSKTHGD